MLYFQAKLDVEITTSKNLRYLLEVSYKGTNYNGWQIQPNGTTIQGTLIKALETILKQKVDMMGSGRTDTGVHAEQQFAHFDTETVINEKFIRSVNALIGYEISALSVKEVPVEFHARYDATSRAYRYRVQFKKNPFGRELFTSLPYTVDVEAMNKAANLLLKHTNFQSFCKVRTQVKTFDCDITEAYWYWENEETLTFYIKANRFLRGMVRAIVGTLLEVGKGDMSLNEFETIIEAKNRREAKAAAPSQGLYLVEVNY